jgi:hypothetical protein
MSNQYQYEVTEIQWDLDDEDITLPSRVFVTAKSRTAALAQISHIYGHPIKFAVIELL